MIYAISGDGNRAGKSTFAKKLTGNVMSLAEGIRWELAERFPKYQWHNKDGHYKDTTIIKELDGVTLRQAMINLGQIRCKDDPTYWVDILVDRVFATYKGVTNRLIAVDDIRKLCELEKLRSSFGPANVLHFHMTTEQAIAEPQYENDQLKALADYVITWNSKK